VSFVAFFGFVIFASFVASQASVCFVALVL